MARFVLAFLLIVSSLTATLAQPTPPTKREELQAIVIKFFDALADLDAEKAKSFCTDDVSILESGQIWNFDSLAVRITTRKAKSADFKRINKLDFIDTKASFDVGWVSYVNQATITSGGKTTKVKWLETVILTKVKNDWRISVLHSTELERKP